MPGRNEPCPCGSGKKYKKCCLQTTTVDLANKTVDLATVVSHFENGNFPAAASTARAFLQINRDEPVAWQLLGVSQYYLGDISAAEKAFWELTKRDIGNAEAFSNLGLMLYEQNKLDLAKQQCDKAISLQPELAGAHNNLGSIYRRQGDIRRAEQSYQTAIRLGLSTPEVYCNLGTVQQEQGKTLDAEQSFQQALKTNPSSIAALSNLAALFLEKGDLASAFINLESAIELDPTDTDVLCNLGMYWQEKGDPGKAKAQYMKALQLNPDDSSMNYRVGLYYHSLMQLNEAKKYYLKAIDINSTHVQSLAKLGEIANIQINTGEAAKYFRQAFEHGGDKHLDVVKSYSDYLISRQRSPEAQPLWNALVESYPDNLKIKLGMANYFRMSGEYDKAEQVYKKAVVEFGKDKRLLIDWAYLEETRHNLDKATKIIKDLLALDPDYIDARLLLAIFLEREKSYKEALEELNHIDLEKQKDDSRVVFYVLFTRAKLLDKVGEFGKAFEDLVKANEIKSTTRGNAYLENKDRDRLLKYRKVFSKENIENFPASINNEIESQITPVFIVGFPRSGTSLLEQILTSHSMISAGGELVFINEIKNQIGSLTGSDLDYPENLIDTQHPVTAEIITQLQHMYIQRVQDNNIVEPGNTFFTDKLPHNLTNLGLISLLFPKSPIIHITRHPMDASLSAFMANFDRGHNYTSSIKNIVTHYALLMQTVEQYKMVLDMRYLQVRYEDLVEDLSTVSQNILDFIGLPWEEACLKFNESKRVVKTASHAQVTEKIYTTSRYRYKNYYKQLEPYAGILQEAMDNFGYSFEP